MKRQRKKERIHTDEQREGRGATRGAGPAKKESERGFVSVFAPKFVELVILGLLVFVVKEVHTSVKSHKALKWDYRITSAHGSDESPDSRKVDFSIYNVGSERRPGTRLYYQVPNEKHEIVSATLEKYQNTWISLLFPAIYSRVDVDEGSVTHDGAASNKERFVFTFNEVSPDWVYLLKLHIKNASGADSGRNRPPIPNETGHVFRRKSATHSGVKPATFSVRPEWVADLPEQVADLP